MISQSTRASPGGLAALLMRDHAALDVGGRALVLGPHAARQHDVGQFRALGQEEVDHHIQFEAASAPCWMAAWSGSETIGLLQICSMARISPCSISSIRSVIAHALGREVLFA